MIVARITNICSVGHASMNGNVVKIINNITITRLCSMSF